MVEAAMVYGKNYTKIAQEIGSKTRGQVAKFANDLYHKATSHPDGTMVHQAFIKETFRPYAIQQPECNSTSMYITELADKFIKAVRVYGKDWEKLSRATGKEKSVLLVFSQMLQEQIEQNNDPNLQDVIDILKSDSSVSDVNEHTQSLDKTLTTDEAQHENSPSRGL